MKRQYLKYIPLIIATILQLCAVSYYGNVYNNVTTTLAVLLMATGIYAFWNYEDFKK